MKKIILCAALILGALAGCGGQGGGGGGGGPGTGGGGPQATQQAATNQPGQPAAPGAGIPVGVQRVDGTPIADVASQPFHDPIVPSPPEKDDPLPPSSNYTSTIYVSPTGSDTADGSQGKPFQTIQKAISVAKAGQRILVAAGTYAEELKIDPSVGSGLENQKIILQGENGAKITAAGNSSAMIHIARAHWVIDGFEIDAQGQPKFAVDFETGSDGSELTNSKVHGGSGGGGVTTSPNASNILIDNNEIWDFTRNDGKDSHGVVLQPGSKNITVRNNDIHDNGADSVQCLGPESFPEYGNVAPADTITIEDNHLFHSRENAVDIKTCSNVTIRHNRMHNFHPNSYAKDGCVVVIHMSAKNVTVDGNEIFDSGKGIAIGGNHTGPVPTNVVVQKNFIHDMKKGPQEDGIGIRLENSSGAQLQNNTFTALDGNALVVGHGTGGPTQNLAVLNNVIDSRMPMWLGSQAPGLKMDHNLYPTGAQFTGPQGNVDINGWRQMGFDPNSKDVERPVADPKSFAADPIAVDAGQKNALPFCGAAIDLGAHEAGC